MLIRSIAIVALAVPSLASPQGGANCNNTTRQSDITAGAHNSLSANCATISFTVGGTTVTTPSSCIVAYAYYFGTVYKCAGTLTNTNCEPHGYHIPVFNYAGGSCPNVTGLVGGSFNSWADVPLALQKAMNCVPPKATITLEWSASTSACPTGTGLPPSELGTVMTTEGGEHFLLLQGDPSAQLTHVPRNAFASAFDLAQTGSVQPLPVSMQHVNALYAPISGASVTADVTIQRFAADGTSDDVRTVHLVGVVMRDGRFDITQSESVDVESVRTVLEARIVFDGASLFALPTGTEAASIYPANYALVDRTFALLTAAIRPVYDWVSDPLTIPLFAQASYQTAVVSPNVNAYRRIVGTGTATTCSEEHVLDESGSQPAPVVTRAYDPLNQVRYDVGYSNPRTLSTGVWRPWLTTQTAYLDATPTGSRVKVTLQISRAAVQTDFTPAPFSDQQVWQIWQ